MGQFLKFAFASCLGVFMAIGLLILGMIFYGMSLMSTPKPKVTSGSVLKISLPYTPPEQTNNVVSVPFALGQSNVLGLHDLIGQIERASGDDRIKGIYFEPTHMYMGPASAELLQAALSDFKENGKFVLTYADYLSQGPYYLASASDHIVLNPIGSVEFTGFSALVPFYRGAMDKVGMKIQIYYAGDFKSATERYRRTDMSPESKLQTREYLDHTYGRFLENISAARDIPIDRLRSIASAMTVRTGQDALDLGLVDQIGYQNNADDWLREKLQLSEDSDPEYIEISDYFQSAPGAPSSTNRIAVVYAAGDIINGEGYSGTIGGERYSEILSKLRKSDRVQAVVLRVNSPGGSILASDLILHEIKQLKEAGKPVVVSMGDYAASGGYYISAFADSIFAEPSTLTGSIGVYSMIPNPHAVLEDMLGITFDTVKTGPNSAAFTPYFPWSDAEDAFMQARTDAYYETFLAQVGEGRSMTREAVHAIGQGRIWTATRAVELGLVDRIAGLEDAIEAAAQLAEVETYRLTTYPKLEDPWSRFLDDLSGLNPTLFATRYVERKIRQELPDYHRLLEDLSNREPMARLPLIMHY